MIFVNRTEKPNVLHVNAGAWTKTYLDARSVYNAAPTKENKEAVAAIEKKYNHTEVKDALKGMFKKKCAFCESFITHIDYGQIEHFKPKSLYPDLCFEWNNFLLSCGVCNGKGNKGDKFPLEADGGPFINPTTENPDDFFRFEYDDVLKRFIVFPKNQRGVTMLKHININREDLVVRRTNNLKTIIFYLEESHKAQRLEEFLALFSEKDEYYAFIKTIISQIHAA